MAVIQEIPKPMDWRVVSLPGNRASDIVEEEFGSLKEMILDIQREADKAVERIGADISDFPEIEFDSGFDPYAVNVLLERFDGAVGLEDAELNMPAPQTVTAPTSPGDAPNVNIELEEFSATADFDTNITPPSANIAYSEPGYTSRLSDTIIDTVLSVMEGGGTSLGKAVEDALWERAKDRIADEYESEYARTAQRWAASGWDIPTGAEDAALAEVDNKRMRALEQVNYEIMIEQARLALANWHKSWDTGLDMERILRDFWNAVWNRALQAATETVRQAIALYVSLYEYNRLKLEKFKSESEVWRTRQEIRAETEKMKLELFRTKIQVFSEQWAGEKTKMEAYMSAVQAEIAKVQAVTAKNQNRIDNLRIQLEAHNSHQGNIVQMEKVKGDVHGSNAQHEQTAAQLAIAAQESNIRNAIERIRMQQEALRTIATLLVQRLASLLSAFNISASLGESASKQESLQHSYSHQDEVSARVSESYDYGSSS